MPAVTRKLASASAVADLASACPPAAMSPWQPVAGYGLGLAVCMAVFVAVFAPWQCDWRIPFCYEADGLAMTALVKGILENGWHWHNPHLGAPFGLELYDYPIPDGLHLAWIKLFCGLTGDAGATFNLYFIVSFPLTMLLTLAVLRRFGVSFSVGISAALLYTFLPWHFQRVEHLFLACYYLVPPAVMVILEVYLGRLSGEGTRYGLSWTRLRAGGICLLVGAAGLYYAFFACFLLTVAGVARFARGKQWRSLLTPILLIALIVFSLFAGILPTVVYQYRNGPNRELGRGPGEAELFGLRMTQLLLPVRDHRVPLLRKVTEQYSESLGKQCNENRMTSLGAIAGAGFVGLLGLTLFGRARRSHPLYAAGVLTMAAFLLGTVSGAGALFNLFIAAHIRGYNRIAIYIAFLSLFAVACLAERLRQRCAGRSWLFHIGLAMVTVLGILDETSPPRASDRARWRDAFQEDARLVAAIESRLPEGAMIYEMPYRQFPEGSRYDLLRPYLHSHKLCWSHGTMRGRLGDDWHYQLAEQPLAERLETAALAGFVGVLVDREGYPDDAAGLEAEVTSCLKVPPIVSDGGQFMFFELSRLEAALRERYTEVERARHREGLLQPITVAWPRGFRWIEETAERIRYRWCAADATMIVSNPLSRSRTMEISFSIDAPDEGGNLSIRSDLFDADLARANGEALEVKRVLEVAPGDHLVRFQFRRDGVAPPGSQAFRLLGFRYREPVQRDKSRP